MTAQVDAIDTKYTGLFLSYFLIFFFSVFIHKHVIRCHNIKSKISL